MVAPDFLSLPVFSDFDFILDLGLIFEIVLGGRHAVATSVGIVEDVLAFGHELVSFVLPENSSSVVTSARKEGPYTVPADAVDWLLVVAQFGKFPHTFELLFFVQGLHHFDVGQEFFGRLGLALGVSLCILVLKN